jgi:hypothetical protein
MANVEMLHMSAADNSKIYRRQLIYQHKSVLTD